MLQQRRRRLLGTLVAAAAMIGLAACSPYSMEIQQGNLLNQSTVAQLKAGMTREQVRFLLGTPLVTDPFRPDRWDYVYNRRRVNSSEVEGQRLAVFFKDDLLDRVEGDVVTGANAPAPSAPAAPTTATN